MSQRNNGNKYGRGTAVNGAATQGEKSGAQRFGSGLVSLGAPKRKTTSTSASGKLTVPKPVNLPSLKKEHAGNDPTTQIVPSGGGWSRPTEQQQATGYVRQPALSTGSTWAASQPGPQPVRPPLGADLPGSVLNPVTVRSSAASSLPGPGAGGRRLNPAEYPSLEAAAKAGSHPPPRQTTVPIPESSQSARNWEDDERGVGFGRHGTSHDRPGRDRFEDDERGPGGYGSRGGYRGRDEDFRGGDRYASARDWERDVDDRYGGRGYGGGRDFDDRDERHGGGGGGGGGYQDRRGAYDDRRLPPSRLYGGDADLLPPMPVKRYDRFEDDFEDAALFPPPPPQREERETSPEPIYDPEREAFENELNRIASQLDKRHSDRPQLDEQPEPEPVPLQPPPPPPRVQQEIQRPPPPPPPQQQQQPPPPPPPPRSEASSEPQRHATPVEDTDEEAGRQSRMSASEARAWREEKRRREEEEQKRKEAALQKLRELEARIAARKTEPDVSGQQQEPATLVGTEVVPPPPTVPSTHQQQSQTELRRDPSVPNGEDSSFGEEGEAVVSQLLGGDDVVALPATANQWSKPLVAPVVVANHPVNGEQIGAATGWHSSALAAEQTPSSSALYASDAAFGPAEQQEQHQASGVDAAAGGSSWRQVVGGVDAASAGVQATQKQPEAAEVAALEASAPTAAGKQQQQRGGRGARNAAGPAPAVAKEEAGRGRAGRGQRSGRNARGSRGSGLEVDGGEPAVAAEQDQQLHASEKPKRTNSRASGTSGRVPLTASSSNKGPSPAMQDTPVLAVDAGAPAAAVSSPYAFGTNLAEEVASIAKLQLEPGVVAPRIAPPTVAPVVASSSSVLNSSDPVAPPPILDVKAADIAKSPGLERQVTRPDPADVLGALPADLYLDTPPLSATHQAPAMPSGAPGMQQHQPVVSASQQQQHQALPPHMQGIPGGGMHFGYGAQGMPGLGAGGFPNMLFSGGPSMWQQPAAVKGGRQNNNLAAAVESFYAAGGGPPQYPPNSSFGAVGSGVHGDARAAALNSGPLMFGQIGHQQYGHKPPAPAGYGQAGGMQPPQFGQFGQLGGGAFGQPFVPTNKQPDWSMMPSSAPPQGGRGAGGFNMEPPMVQQAQGSMMHPQGMGGYGDAGSYVPMQQQSAGLLHSQPHQQPAAPHMQQQPGPPPTAQAHHQQQPGNKGSRQHKALTVSDAAANLPDDVFGVEPTAADSRANQQGGGRGNRVARAQGQGQGRTSGGGLRGPGGRGGRARRTPDGAETAGNPQGGRVAANGIAKVPQQQPTPAAGAVRGPAGAGAPVASAGVVQPRGRNTAQQMKTIYVPKA